MRIGQNASLEKVCKIVLTFVVCKVYIIKVAEHGNNKQLKNSKF